MEPSDKGNFWDRIGVYVVIAGLFAGGAVICVLLTQQLLSSNPSVLALQAQADKGNAAAQYALGEAYLYGNFGLKKDMPRAEAWLRKAEDQHYVEAGCELASIRFNYVDPGITDAEALRWFQEGVDAGDVECMNNAAWFKATSPDPAVRDPQAAVSIAKAAVQKNPASPNILDTLAAAYAADGQYDEAASEQQRAMDALQARPGDHTLSMQKMQARLALYRQHQAYVEPPIHAPAAATTKP